MDRFDGAEIQLDVVVEGGGCAVGGVVGHKGGAARGDGFSSNAERKDIVIVLGGLYGVVCDACSRDRE